MREFRSEATSLKVVCILQEIPLATITINKDQILLLKDLIFVYLQKRLHRNRSIFIDHRFDVVLNLAAFRFVDRKLINFLLALL